MMNNQSRPFSPHLLPVTRDLTLAYILSFAIASLMLLAPLAGFLNRAIFYPGELLMAFAPNDLANLFIGLPILLASMWLARGGKLTGLLFWPGALFFALYSYALYLLSLPFSGLFPVHLLLVTLSASTLIGLLAAIDGEAVRRRLSGSV